MTIALITGASRGMGATTARRLAEQGVTVLAAARRPGEVSVPEDLDIRPLALDVTDQTSVDAAAAAVERAVGAIDVLINNAGVPGTWASAEDVGPDDFSAVLDVNVVGAVRVTRAFLPLLRRGEHPRLLMVSSGMGSLTLQTTDEVYRSIHHLPYPASKAALNMVTVQYAKSLPDVIVTAVDPGLTATEFTDFAGHSVEEGTDATVGAALDTVGPSGRFLDRLGPVCW